MATLKDLIVQGASRFIGDVIGNKFIVNGGTSSQFLKADGSVDSNVYITACTCLPYAPVSSPIFTGTPIAPTAANGTKTNQIATTCFVQKAITSSAGSDVNWNNEKSCLTKTLNGTTTSIVNATTIVQSGASSIIADASCTCSQKNKRAYSARYIDSTFATIADVEDNERVTAEALADLEEKQPLIVHFTNENDTWTANTSINDIAAAAGEGRTVWGEALMFGNVRMQLLMYYENFVAVFSVFTGESIIALEGQIQGDNDVWTYEELTLPTEFKTINNTSIIGSGSISLPTTERVDEIEETTAAALNELNNNKLSWDDTTNTLNQSSNLPTSNAVYCALQSAIQNIPTPMQFKGSLGTSGTYTASTLPAASSTNKGWTVKVITAGTYRSIAANVGDVLVSDGSTWVLIPSGDEPSGTVTSVGLSMPTGFTVSSTPVTTSGTISVTMTSGYAIPTTTQVTCWNNKVSNVQSDWNATSGSAVILNKPTVISSIGYNSPGGYLTANNSNAVQLTVCSSNGRKLNIGGSTWQFTSTTEPSASADKSTIAPTWSAMTSAISEKATAVSATAGTYRSVTVNSQGLVTAGTNPTTLSGYGITDAKIANGVITLGSNTITPLTSHQTLKTINSTAITGSGNISIPVVANLNAPNSLPSGASGTGVTISSTNYYLVSDKPYCTSSDVNVAPSWNALQSCLNAVRTEMGSSTGGVTIYSGSSTPSSSLGSNGDIYIQTT